MSPSGAATPKAFIVPGRYGDIIQLLPAFLSMFENTGNKPVVVVSSDYASVLEGVSYVIPWVMNFNWIDGVPAVRAKVEAEGFQAVVPAWWNDSKPEADKVAATCPGRFYLTLPGRVWAIDDSKWTDFGTSTWAVLGFTRQQMLDAPLVFDKRDATREAALVKRFARGKKPVVLYNLRGVSSPFPATPELVNPLLRMANQFELVDLGQISCHRIYDLLGLFDVAAGLITCDTATLHLAAASTIPCIVFSQDGWLGAVPKCRVAAHWKYSQARTMVNRAISIVGSWRRASEGKKEIVVRRSMAVGDAVAATCVAKKLKEAGYSVTFQTVGAIHPVIRHSMHVDKITEPVGRADIDLDGAYERNLNRRTRSFSSIFIEEANRQVVHKAPVTLTVHNSFPELFVPQQDCEAIRTAYDSHPRPWVVVAPRSNNWVNRTVSDEVWQALPGYVKGTCFWLGTHAAAPAGFVDLRCRDLGEMVKLLAVPDLFVGVDSGPMHVAAALGTPSLIVQQASAPDLHLSNQRDFQAILPPGFDCLNCQQDRCPKGNPPPCQRFPADWLGAAINRKLGILGNGVAAVIPVFHPNVDRVNRCIQAVASQVDEIVVTGEGSFPMPDFDTSSGKVMVVQTSDTKIGYGRNVNFGARHTNSGFLLLLNDDVFLKPDAVAKMLEVAADDVGMVANVLRYPDGSIYHAGKIRSPGVRAWGHVDYRKKSPTITNPTEMENVCGACVLVRRKAFYQMYGFDEDFFVYAEDDDFALRLRMHGWKIMFTPHSEGTHLEHQSTQKLGRIETAIAHANALFDKKWRAYFDHNLNRIPGDFDYLRKP